MKANKGLWFLISLALMVSVSGYSQDSVDYGKKLDEISMKAGYIKEKSLKLKDYLHKIDSLEEVAEKSRKAMDEYLARPFSKMDVKVLERLPSEKKDMLSYYGWYSEGIKVLANVYDENDIKDAIINLKKISNINAVQEKERKHLVEQLNKYLHCNDAFLDMINLKNNIYTEEAVTTGYVYSELWRGKINPWDEFDKDHKLKKMIKKLEDEYFNIPYLKKWLANYSKLLFEDRCNPYTGDKENIKVKNELKEKIEVNADLKNKESIFKSNK